MSPEQEQQAKGLMIRAQKGDAESYEVLLTLLAAAARQFARRRVGDVAWVEDVAQEILISVHAARHTYDGRRPFSPWFYAIVSNRLVDQVRKQRRVAAREVATAALPDLPGPTRPSSTAFDAASVGAALDLLPPRQREVVSALKLHDESVKEISVRLGMTPSAVKVTAHRGYRALRRLLGGRPS